MREVNSLSGSLSYFWLLLMMSPSSIIFPMIESLYALHRKGSTLGQEWTSENISFLGVHAFAICMASARKASLALCQAELSTIWCGWNRYFSLHVLGFGLFRVGICLLRQFIKSFAVMKLCFNAKVLWCNNWGCKMLVVQTKQTDLFNSSTALHFPSQGWDLQKPEAVLTFPIVFFRGMCVTHLACAFRNLLNCLTFLKLSWVIWQLELQSRVSLPES